MATTVQPVYIQFASAAVTVYEGDRSAIIPITRTRAIGGVSAEVHPATGGSAKKGKDFLYDATNPPRVTWDSDTALTGKAEIPIQENNLLQGDRTLILHFAKLVGCKKGTAQVCTVTIKDGSNPATSTPTPTPTPTPAPTPTPTPSAPTYTYTIGAADDLVARAVSSGFAAADTISISSPISSDAFKASIKKAFPPPPPPPPPTVSPLIGSGQIFFVSGEGDDTKDGLTPETAWKTVDKVNQQLAIASAGTKILFKGGEWFAGPILPSKSSDPANPILIGSYLSDSGDRAIIYSNSNGLYAYNVGGVTIQDLLFVGWNQNSDGILFYSDANAFLDKVLLRNLKVYGFQKSGIAIGSSAGNFGYSTIEIIGSEIFKCGRNGILIYAQNNYVHGFVRIAECVAHAISGIAGATDPTGSGIVVGGAKSGLVERCQAFDNGWLSTASSGPVGIWCYNSSNVVIEHCEAFLNYAKSGGDGDGFDIDDWSQNCTIQYCYSHDNDGAGLNCYQHPDRPGNNNTIRYNLTENNGLHNGANYLMGEISVGGACKNTKIYNNTCITSSRAVDVMADFNSSSSANFYNNIFFAKNAILLNINSSSATQADLANLIFEGNCWYGGSFRWAGGQPYPDFNSWKAQSGKESRGLAVNADPKIVGGTRIVGAKNLELLLDQYQLASDSPCINKGIDLATLSIDMGNVDFWGNPNKKGAPDLGAFELQ